MAQPAVVGCSWSVSGQVQAWCTAWWILSHGGCLTACRRDQPMFCQPALLPVKCGLDHGCQSPSRLLAESRQVSQRQELCFGRLIELHLLCMLPRAMLTMTFRVERETAGFLLDRGCWSRADQMFWLPCPAWKALPFDGPDVAVVHNSLWGRVLYGVDTVVRWSCKQGFFCAVRGSLNSQNGKVATIPKTFVKYLLLLYHISFLK